MTYNYIVEKIVTNKMTVKVMSDSENNREITSAELQHLTSFLLNAKTVYRGDNTPLELQRYFYDLTIIGIKSNAYRSEEFPIHFNDLDSYHNTLLTRLKNTYNTNRNFTTKFVIDKYIDAINHLNIEEKIFITSAIIHNLYNDCKFNRTTNNISCSYRFSVAKKFTLARNNNNKPYVIVSIADQIMKSINSQNIFELLDGRNIEYFLDIHREKIINHGIFPHYLIGFIDLNNYFFYINEYTLEQICTFDTIDNFSVEQSDFFQAISRYNIRWYANIEDEQLQIFPWN